MINYQSLKKQLLSEREVKKMYDELGPEFLVIEKMIEKRLTKNLSQSQLADLVGTKQSAISRFESGKYNPSMSFLYKVADALGAKLTFNIS